MVCNQAQLQAGYLPSPNVDSYRCNNLLGVVTLYGGQSINTVCRHEGDP